MNTIDLAPVLQGARISLRPLAADDRAGLFLAASDPEIWAQHPVSRRYQPAVFNPYFDYLLNAGGTLVAVDTLASLIIGCSRFYPVPDQPGEIGIGFTFLARSHWGGAWNREMKALMVAHVLARMPRVWFHIAPTNTRSQIATTRLGAQFAYDADLALGAEAVPYKCYVMTAADWNAASQGAPDL